MNENLYTAMGLRGQAPGAADAEKPSAARRTRPGRKHDPKKLQTFWIRSCDKTRHRDHERFNLKRSWSKAWAKTGDQRSPENIVAHRKFLFGSDGAFECDLGFKACKIPADRSDRQFLAAAAIAYRAVARLETALDVRLVPAFGMPHVGNLQIVLFGPEEGDGVESFTCPEDIAGGRLALSLGDNKVFELELIRR